MYQYRYYLPGVKDMFIFFALFIAGALVADFVIFMLTALVGNYALHDYTLLISYPIQFLPLMIYAAVKSGRNSLVVPPCDLNRDLGGGSKTFWTCLAAVIATICAALVTEPITALLPPMPEFFKKMMDMLMSAPLEVTLLCASVFAPFFEEWLCRGMVLRGLLSRTKPVYAILISAAFFAVIHLNPWQAIPAFILGCLFGLVYYKTGSLKLTMLMHCANNTFSILISRLPGCEDCDYLWQAIPEFKTYLLLYCVCLALLAMFVVRIRSHTKTLEQIQFHYSNQQKMDQA